MPIGTATLTLTLVNPDGTNRQGVDVTYRIGAMADDDDDDAVDEAVIRSERVTVQTNSTGVASFTVPASAVVYVTCRAAGVPEARITAPASGTLELASVLNLPTPV